MHRGLRRTAPESKFPVYFRLDESNKAAANKLGQFSLDGLSDVDSLFNKRDQSVEIVTDQTERLGRFIDFRYIFELAIWKFDEQLLDDFSLDFLELASMNSEMDLKSALTSKQKKVNFFR